MSNGKKIAVALTRAFAGLYGVDCFLMGRIASGVWRIVFTIGSFVLVFLLYILYVIPYVGALIAYVLQMIILISLVVRNIIFFITGLIMLGKTPEQVELKY